MPRTDRASRVVDAPVDRVFQALVDRDALLAWLPPRGMKAEFERFDPRPGGSYRLVLTYADPAGSPGKSSADSDIVEARFVDVVPDVRVVQAVDFVSDDPEFAGTMTMTWAVTAVDGGARVDITADDVPDGISAEDHAAGIASSLENLATYVESSLADAAASAAPGVAPPAVVPPAPADLREQVLARPWFHRIDLGGGLVTPGVDDTPAKLLELGLPDDLSGLSVLDVGAYDGFFSFESERRGAARVVAADSYCWSIPGGMGDGRGFDLAHAALGSSVEKRVLAVEDLDPATVGTFDLVLFLGVLYHAPDPLGYLRRVRSVCRGRAVVETHTDGEDVARPAMVFYPGDTLNGDASNHWGPNAACVEAMLLDVGFSRVERMGTYNGNRLVVHAHV